MVLESLFSAKLVEQKPLYMLVASFLVTLASIFISNYIFPDFAGWTIPLLVSVTMSPLIFRIFRYEEEIEREVAENRIKEGFMQRHGETILLFSLFFLGNFLAIFITAMLMPVAYIQSTFSQQIDAIKAISSLTVYATAYAVISEKLSAIVLNNIKVMVITFLLSFILGTGALIILSWNASILAIYLSSFLKQGLIGEFAARTLGILPHAPIEFLAYFLAGIAGGILSVGVIREKIMSREFKFVLKDSIILFALSIIAVLFGGFIEVYI